MTLEQKATRLVRKWKANLGLQDWRSIEARIIPLSELVPDTLANASWDSDDQTAEVWLADCLTDDQLEPCIVHELIHLVLEGEGQPAEYCVHRERKINKLTRAILRIKH